MTGIEVAGASGSDADQALALQELAGRGEAGIYHDLQIPPLTQTLAELREDFRYARGFNSY